MPPSHTASRKGGMWPHYALKQMCHANKVGNHFIPSDSSTPVQPGVCPGAKDKWPLGFPVTCGLPRQKELNKVDVSCLRK